MAGKLIADILEHSTAGSLDTSYVVNGSLKASFSVNQTANTTPLSSHNIASLVDTGTGQTTYNLTNAFSSANEHSAVLSGNDASTWYYYTLYNFTSSAATTAVGTGAHDVDRLSILANGDLA